MIEFFPSSSSCLDCCMSVMVHGFSPVDKALLDFGHRSKVAASAVTIEELKDFCEKQRELSKKKKKFEN